MRVGIVGLGRTGGGLAAEGVEAGYTVVGFDPDESCRQALAERGGTPVNSLEELVGALAEPPRVCLLAVPDDGVAEQTIETLAELLRRGDVVADVGKSHWQRSVARHDRLEELGIRFLDVATTGGTGSDSGRAGPGPCFTAGGPAEGFEELRSLLVDLTGDERAVFHAGPAGAGHFLKVVHDAIEVGMVQAVGEGVELIARSDYDVDLPALFDNWAHGSVVRGWLVELMRDAFEEQPNALSEVSTYVEGTGSVDWILSWALERDVPTPVTAVAQQQLLGYRDAHRQPPTPMATAVAMLRHAFAEHPLYPRGQ